MDGFGGIGRLLILAGAVLACIGALLLVAGRGGAGDDGLSDWFGWLGRLPGDISIKRDHYSFYFPFTTSIVISLVLSLLWYFMNFLGKR
ncbi:hypothetical protein YTPLAS18_09160 [Nitrospira sp.]|nr:hypothetical protein YTPLAS18_09160 [Nitrospira sp.]